MEDRIWLDDFTALWFLPLVMFGCLLVSGFLVLGAMRVLWPH